MKSPMRRATAVAALASLILVFGGTSPLVAQRWVEAEAVVGEPFGVGRVVVELPKDLLPEPLGIEGVGLSEADGRVLYPTFDHPAAGKVVKTFLDSDTPLTSGGPVREQVGGLLRGLLDRPPRMTIYFLFRGDGPLQLSLMAKRPIPLTVTPHADPAVFRRLLLFWWKPYAKPDSLLEPKPDYPPVVDNYVMTTLARRLNLRLPERRQTESAYAALRKEIGLNLGDETLVVAMQQDRILGLTNLGLPAEESLPPTPEVEPLDVPEPSAVVKVEPLACRVPIECFYARFGSFANFVWLQDTLAQWGGDVQNLIALRGLDRGMSSHIERQLVLKQTVLSRMLGNTVMADVAIIGTDMFFREGASYGILFQARSNLAASTNFAQQRQERVRAGGVSERKITIDGHAVSYLSSPDGAVRSYYVVDGDFHFFTTSRRLVSRFLKTGQSPADSLGRSKEFQHARELMPIGRDDTVWVYLSDAFFRNLTGPTYRIEMARRLQAAADIELVQLARLAAHAEQSPGETIEQLVAAGLLPPDFGPLPGGSRTVLQDGLVSNSIRGFRGDFLPVADCTVDKITRAERSEYEKFNEYYRTTWGRMDPILAGVKRIAEPQGRDRIVVDVLMDPLAPQHVDRLRRWLGPADRRQLTPVPGDMAALEIASTEQHLFGAIRDVGRPAGVSLSQWLPMGRLRDYVVGYVGTDGPLGPLGFLNLGIPDQSDAAGYAESPVGGWRREFGPFTVFSFQPEVLEQVAPQLAFQEAARPAQVRLRVDDVSQATITSRLNELLWTRTRATSLGNLRLLWALNQQFHVPPAECRDVAELLLDAKLICPLGGRYVLRQTPGETPQWTSSAMSPPDHGHSTTMAPPLNWFRGLTFDATMTDRDISAHAEVLMQGPTK
ncbi:MAG: hypothetical protein ABFC88_10345 [Thermoguttaceae bacterium]